MLRFHSKMGHPSFFSFSLLQSSPIWATSVICRWLNQTLSVDRTFNSKHGHGNWLKHVSPTYLAPDGRPLSSLFSSLIILYYTIHDWFSFSSPCDSINAYLVYKRILSASVIIMMTIFYVLAFFKKHSTDLLDIYSLGNIMFLL